MVKTSSFGGQKEWLEICAMFYKDGVEEIMRNASYFVVFFLVKELVTFSQSGK
jgi:hypothetical protein